MSEAAGGDPEYRPVWKNRRRVIFANLAFSAGIILYQTFFGEDTRLAETTVIFAFINAMATVGAYAFNATWEDVTRLRK